MQDKKRIVVFLGPAGSGKGTQADMLGKVLHLPVVSPGELLRHERDQGTEIGKQVAEKMAKGILVSDEVVEEIIGKRLLKDDVAQGYILDGYPRRQEQLSFLSKRLGNMEAKSVLAIYIDASDKKIKKRISGRRVCDCGAAYHIKNNPPKVGDVCDECGKKVYQRKDDSPEILAGRLERFHGRTAPLLDFFKENFKLIKIDGDRSIEDVKKDIWQIFNF